jgi:FAD/FMN-containing dehydrogenase
MHAPRWEAASSNETRIVNYDGAITASPRKLVRPGSVAEIQRILGDTVGFPAPVRAMGSFHSLTPCVSTEGTVIDMGGMNRVIALDTANMTFTAEAGMEFIEASRLLRRAGLQFVTNIEIGNITLGAAACCHTKDGLDGAEFGQVGSYVTEVKWVTPRGDLAYASETNDPASLRLIRSSYGLAGVIYQVTFRVKPLSAVHFSYLPRPVKELTETEVNRIIDGAEGLVCWTIGKTAVFQTRRSVARAGATGPLFAAIRRRLWSFGDAHRARLTDKYVPTQTLKDLAHDARFATSRLLMHTLHAIGGWSLLGPDKIVDYTHTPQSARYAFTFWAFPREQWLQMLREYLEFADAYRAKYGFYCNMALGSYFVRKDQNAVLSYSHDGDIFSIDPIHAPTDQAAWDRFLREFNEFATKRNGIPLLNQSPFVTRAHVQHAYGARWDELAQWVHQQDPNRRMVNPFFDALL